MVCSYAVADGTRVRVYHQYCTGSCTQQCLCYTTSLPCSDVVHHSTCSSSTACTYLRYVHAMLLLHASDASHQMHSSYASTNAVALLTEQCYSDGTATQSWMGTAGQLHCCVALVIMYMHCVHVPAVAVAIPHVTVSSDMRYSSSVLDRRTDVRLCM